MNFYLHLDHALTSLKRAPLMLTLGSLLVSAMVVFSFALLSGPLYGAYLAMIIRMQRDGQQPEPQDLFRGFARLKQLFPFFFLVLVLLAGFGIYVLPGLILSTIWIYTLPLMADRGLALLPAMNNSAIMVKDKGFFKHLLFVLLITIVPTILLNALADIIPDIRPILLPLLFLFLAPIQVGCVASLYLRNFPPELVVDPNKNPDPALDHAPINPHHGENRQGRDEGRDPKHTDQ